MFLLLSITAFIRVVPKGGTGKSEDPFALSYLFALSITQQHKHNVCHFTAIQRNSQKIQKFLYLTML